jgi:hypothetical protein
MQTQAPSVIARLEAFITEELSPPDLDSLYDDMLDECYSFEKVGGPFACMSPSSVLKEVDPIAYRCGLNDWADQDYVEVGDKMYGKEEVREKQEEFCEQIRGEIEELEEEIEEVESIPDHDPNAGRLPALREQLASLQSDLQTAERHCF